MVVKNIRTMKELDIIRMIKNEDTDRRAYNECVSEIFRRYDNMIHKHWWMLQNEMSNSPKVNSLKDEFYELAYESILKSIDKIDFTKTYNDNFKIMQFASWYLSNARLKIRRKILGKESKIKSITYTSVDDDKEYVDYNVEEAYQSTEGYKLNPEYILEIREREMRCQDILNKCVVKWSDSEKMVYNMLIKGVSYKDIATEKGWDIAKVNSIVRKMKKDLKESLNYSSKMKFVCSK